jgi:hypothetical protein
VCHPFWDAGNRSIRLRDDDQINAAIGESPLNKYPFAKARMERIHDPRLDRLLAGSLSSSREALDHTNIDILLKQLGRKGVPQSMGSHALLEIGHLGGGMAGGSELTCRYRVGWGLAPKQPSLRPRHVILEGIW